MRICGYPEMAMNAFENIRHVPCSNTRDCYVIQEPALYFQLPTLALQITIVLFKAE
jgi:hypothetical protein